MQTLNDNSFYFDNLPIVHTMQTFTKIKYT
jgi:hypothetical protein